METAPPKQKRKSLPRAKTAKQLIEKRRELMQFTGPWLDAFGTPEPGFFCIIWAKSFSGKTRFMLRFCKYLAENFGTVNYNSLEEGDVNPFAEALAQTSLDEVPSFKVVQESWEDTVDRLCRPRSATFTVIDSLQYTELTYEQYKKDKRRLVKKGKSILFISHAEGNNPAGKTAQKIRYDVDCKIQIIGYIAKVEMRGNGRKVFIIWEEGAKKYWGKKYNAVAGGKYWPGDKK